jgi:hypothetical protein
MNDCDICKDQRTRIEYLKRELFGAEADTMVMGLTDEERSRRESMLVRHRYRLGRAQSDYQLHQIAAHGETVD